MSSSHDAPAEQARRRSSTLRWMRPLLWWGGLFLITVGAVPGINGPAWFHIRDPWAQPPWIVGSVVFSPWLLLFIAVAIGLTCWAGCFILWAHPVSRPDAGRRPLERVGAIAVSVIAVPVTLLGLLGAAGDLTGVNSYAILTPTSPAGCRIVAQRDRGGLQGRMFLAVPGSATLRQTTAWWAVEDPSEGDPGQADPIKAGTWSLSWKEKTAHLRIWGTSSTGRLISFAMPSPLVCPARLESSPN